MLPATTTCVMFGVAAAILAILMTPGAASASSSCELLTGSWCFQSISNDFDKVTFNSTLCSESTPLTSFSVNSANVQFKWTGDKSAEWVYLDKTQVYLYFDTLTATDASYCYHFGQALTSCKDRKVLDITAGDCTNDPPTPPSPPSPTPEPATPSSAQESCETFDGLWCSWSGANPSTLTMYTANCSEALPTSEVIRTGATFLAEWTSPTNVNYVYKGSMYSRRYIDILTDTVMYACDYVGATSDPTNCDGKTMTILQLGSCNGPKTIDDLMDLANEDPLCLSSGASMLENTASSVTLGGLTALGLENIVYCTKATECFVRNSSGSRKVTVTFADTGYLFAKKVTVTVGSHSVTGVVGVTDCPGSFSSSFSISSVMATAVVSFVLYAFS